MRRGGRIIPFPRRGAAAPAEGGEPRGLVELYRCDHAEAIVVKGLLESEGIPAVFRSRLAHSVHPFSVGSQGEIVILVPAAGVARARLLLARIVPGQPPPGSELS